MTDLGAVSLAFVMGVSVGLLLAWVVIPGIVDLWASGLRRARGR
jgi:hypothetical protein